MCARNPSGLPTPPQYAKAPRPPGARPSIRVRHSIAGETHSRTPDFPKRLQRTSPKGSQRAFPKESWPASQFCCRVLAMALVGPNPLLDTNPLRRGARGPARGARGERAVPARRHALLARAHAALRQRSAAAAARGLRALRARLHAAAVPRQRRLHARAGGQPLHHRLPRRQLHLARIALPRPDRADGRRAADDRRRLPPALAPDRCSPAFTASGSPPRSR